MVMASLTRRLISHYLMYSLAGLLVCISTALTLTWRDAFMQSVALAAIFPLSVLLLGTVLLGRAVRNSESIERQLREISTSASVIETLQPLVSGEVTAIGWNRLVEQLQERRTLEMLESRLTGSMNSLESKRWEILFDSLPDGIAVCDDHGVIASVNNALVALLQAKTKDEIHGRSIVDLLAASVASDSDAGLKRLRTVPGPVICEVCRTSNLMDGVWRVHRTCLLTGQSHGESMLWIVRDVTQQKMAEEMRNQFVFTATHELRTPLANIKAYAETLALDETIDVERQKGFFNIINAEATRLSRFVDELLNVNQMEAGAISISRHDTNIARLLEEVVEYQQPQIAQQQIIFTQTVPPKLPELRIDKDKVAAALANILGNAIKYTPLQGHVRLLVEVDSAFVHFHIEDTGIGISQEELPRLGQKFFRSNDSRVQAITGSGLGLAFTREVAKLHGGNMVVQSELNKGSRVTLSLPLD